MRIMAFADLKYLQTVGRLKLQLVLHRIVPVPPSGKHPF